MQIAIITVKRTPAYIHSTIASLFRTTPHLHLRVELFPGSLDTSDIERYRIEPNITVRGLDAQRANVWGALQTFQRAAGNFLRALDSDPRRDVLLLEDDIEFKSEWHEALDEAREAYPDALITLYGHPSIAAELRGASPGVHRIPWDVFYGTLALYVPAVFRGELAGYTEKRYTSTARSWPFDECVRYFAKEHGVPLVATMPSWVDHRGDVPAIAENRKHGPRRSPIF